VATTTSTATTRGGHRRRAGGADRRGRSGPGIIGGSSRLAAPLLPERASTRCSERSRVSDWGLDVDKDLPHIMTSHEEEMQVPGSAVPTGPLGPAA
jgi:hypothetical protein